VCEPLPVYGQIGVLQPYDLPVTKGVRAIVHSAAKAADSSQRKGKIKNGKMKLRSPHDTEAEAVEAAGRAAEALRRAAVVGDAAPAAAAQQTV